MPEETKENWGHLTKIFRELMRSAQGPAVIRNGILLLILVILFNILNVISSFIGRDFISSIEQKRIDVFYSKSMLYAFVFLISAGIGSIYRYSEERLGILWREQLTWKFTENYLTEMTYHKIISQNGIENPDQRITDDVRAFTTTTLSFALLIIGGIFSALSFAGVLWSINPLLFFVAALYALVGTITTIFLGKSLIRINYDQLDMEATYRADLLHIRQHAESIAVTHREPWMSLRLKSKLKNLVFNFRKLISVNLRLSMFTNSYNYFIQIIPMLLIAPSYMRGEIQFGVITQAALAFTTLLNAFSLIVTQFQSISAFTAVVKRLKTLDTVMKNIEEESKSQRIDTYNPNEIIFEHFSLLSNDKSKYLIEDLNLKIKQNERWLITSFDENLKLSFFRSIAGVSSQVIGNLEKPSWEDLLFLPEQPYLPPGRLRNIIVPAFLSKDISDQEIRKELQVFGLDSILSRYRNLSVLKEWNDELSLAEKFKISLIRILFVKPKFLVLDRPGTSLSKFEISKMIKLFQKLGTTVVVISKDEETALEYDYHLNISHFGKWKLVSSPHIKSVL
ncbi:MAG: SbmA/BacA-like family transporter [Leptospira sp.]|nr:SbmA/BacA-like family transporter [Leptospira sp.]